MESKKVYAIIESDYNYNYTICIFSTKKKAQKYIKEYNWDDSHDATIKTWILDTLPSKSLIHQYFVVGIKMKSGEVTHQSKSSEIRECEEYIEYKERLDEYMGEKVHSYTYREYYIPNTEGMTMEKATEIVIEKRRRWLYDNGY